MTSKYLFAGLLCILLATCAPGRVPVIDKSPNRTIPARVLVGKGDTLYSIAWQYGLDYRQIAKWNGIKKPYLIRPKQAIRLRPGAPPNAPSTARAAPAVPEPSAATKTRTGSGTQPARSTLPGKAPREWGWPAKGRLVGRFSRTRGHNGIKIAGNPGSAIRSTAAGEVVYVGEGIRGYGKLIIVKHSTSYLSAYAHNRTIMVAEGERIKYGQQIAQMGSSGTDRTMLHFEIRKDGKPLDPLKFLN